MIAVLPNIVSTLNRFSKMDNIIHNAIKITATSKTLLMMLVYPLVVVLHSRKA